MLKLKEKEVRELIAKTGLSVRAWSAENGFPQPTVSSWLNGARNIKKTQLVKLADALGVNDLSLISYVEFHIDNDKQKQLDGEIEEINRLWMFLPLDQRKSILSLIRTIAESNK